MALQRRDGAASFSVAGFRSFRGTARASCLLPDAIALWFPAQRALEIGRQEDSGVSVVVSKLNPDAGVVRPEPRREDLLELDGRSTRLHDLWRD